MEERKLNFNAPLLSVRRYSTTTVASSDGDNGKFRGNSVLNRRYTIPFYRTDMNLEQVTEPVAVPFTWEKTPGRPKDGGSEPQHSDEASVNSRHPPQRALDIIKYALEKEFEDSPRAESRSLNENVARLDFAKGGNDLKEQSDIEDDDDDGYSDALNTLSPTDSCSINCSVSGLSGSDGQVVKRSGTFSKDPHMCDFMMSRFLPAAKAMALEPPQYASRKQTMEIEQPRHVIKVVSEDRRHLVDESIVIPHYGEDVEEKLESEEEVAEYDDSGNLSSKDCGLYPQLCLDKSLCLLNPVPGLKVRTNSLASTRSDVRNLGRAAFTESHSQSVKKHARDSVHRYQADSGVQSPKLLGIESKMTCGSNRFACSRDQQMASRSSPFRRGISPYRNERPQSPFRGGGFLGVPKEGENGRANKLNSYNRANSRSQELFPHHSFRKGLGSRSPSVEKTLYVDSVNFAKLSDTNGQMDSAVVKNFQTSMEIRTASAESSLEDVNCLNTARHENISETKILGSFEAQRSIYSEKIFLPEGQEDTTQCLRLDEEPNQECKSLVCISFTADENLNSSMKQKLEVDDPGYINSDSEQSPLPPPLPKKPSESWLWRTLPSVSSQNSFSKLNLGTRFNPKKQDPKALLTNTKWETIVKTSYAHHNHVRYSEELTSHFSQQSKT